VEALEATEFCTALRYFNETPVPRKDLAKLLYSAPRASNRGNSQGWEFVVIDDQNLNVAARSMNIGTGFTTFHRSAEPMIIRLCHIPDDVHCCLFVAVGCSEGQFMPAKRKPVENALHWNKF